MYISPKWSSREFSILCTCLLAKSLQSYPTLCDPIDSSPPGSSVPGILKARTLEWVAISHFSNAWKWKVKVKSLSRVRLVATQWAAAHQAPPSMGFPGKGAGVGGLPSPLLCTRHTQKFKCKIHTSWVKGWLRGRRQGFWNCFGNRELFMFKNFTWLCSFFTCLPTVSAKIEFKPVTAASTWSKQKKKMIFLKMLGEIEVHSLLWSWRIQAIFWHS